MTQSRLRAAQVLVTRPEDQADELVQAISAAGGRAIRFPVIRITGRDSVTTYASELAMLPPPDILIFVSRNAVRPWGAGISRNGVRACCADWDCDRASIEGRRSGDVDIQPEGGSDSEHLLAHPERCKTCRESRS